MADRTFDIINGILMAVIFAVCFYPLYYIVVVSFSKEVVGSYLLPQGFTLAGYEAIFQNKDVWSGYANTIWYTVVGVLASLVVTLPCAYSLSRKDCVGRNLVMAFIMVTMYIGGGLVPSYINVSRLGLINNRLVIILLSLTTAYNLILARSFFHTTIPDDLLEAARMDGCGNGRFFVQVVMPLSKPITAVMALYFGVARWNSYFSEMVYLRDTEKYPLSLILRRLLWSIEALQAMIEEGLIENVSQATKEVELAGIMQYCLIVVSTIPMMIIYPFVQKYFAKGVMIGAVKG